MPLQEITANVVRPARPSVSPQPDGEVVATKRKPRVPSSLPSFKPPAFVGSTARPRFLPSVHQAPSAPCPSRGAEVARRTPQPVEAIPSSTQFVLDHLDDLFPTPSQEALELLELPPPKPKSAQSLRCPFFSTQDFVLSSQDIRELGDTPSKVMPGPPPTRAVTPAEKRREPPLTRAGTPAEKRREPPPTRAATPAEMRREPPGELVEGAACCPSFWPTYRAPLARRLTGALAAAGARQSRARLAYPTATGQAKVPPRRRAVLGRLARHRRRDSSRHTARSPVALS